MGTPVKLHLSDSLLFIIDVAKNPVVEVLDRTNYAPVCKAIYKGKGPDEILFPIDTQLSDSELCVLERQTGRYKHFSLSGIDSGYMKCRRTVQLPLITDRALFLDSAYVACGIYDEGLMLLRTEDGEPRSAYSPCPDFIREVGDKHLRYRLGQGRLAFKNGKLIFTTLFTGEISVFDLKKGLQSPTGYATIDRDRILDKIRQRSERKDYAVYKTDLIGCQDVFATNNYFYVFYTDNRFEGIKNDYAYVLKFDYSANLQACYKTDRQFTCFAVDSDDKCLYAIAENSDSEYVLVFARLND